MQRGLTTALTQAAIFGSLILTAAVGFGVASYMLLGDPAEASASQAAPGAVAPGGPAADPFVMRALDEAMRVSSSAASGSLGAAATRAGGGPDPAGQLSESRASAALAVRSEPQPSPEDVALLVAADDLLPSPELELAPTSVAPPPVAQPSITSTALTAYPGAGVAPELSPGERIEATVSFYYCERSADDVHPGDGGGFCGAMRDGTTVYPGAAACSYDYLGQLFRIEGDPTGRVYRCNDTGNAVLGLHRDIWFQSSDEGWLWAFRVGQRAVIEILP